MQTFLPYPNFTETAKCLDYKRLGKQRVEAMQILKILLGHSTSKAWSNHPAVKMWRGHEFVLIYYAHIICDEWVRRGYKDTCSDKISGLIQTSKVDTSYDIPAWLGGEKFHAAHRSNLLRKNSEYYSKFGWKEPDDLPYIWPV